MVGNTVAEDVGFGLEIWASRQRRYGSESTKYFD